MMNVVWAATIVEWLAIAQTFRGHSDVYRRRAHWVTNWIIGQESVNQWTVQEE